MMHMTNICNAMLRLRHFPSQWKQDVVMIPKPGQPHNWPQNYRHISLLPVMGKIADRIILTRLQEETDDLDVIPNCQFRFCRGHSTAHQVLRIVEQIKEGFNRREYTGAVFLDVAKTLDKIWHQGLLLKMHRAGISRAMVRLIHSFSAKGPSKSSWKDSGPRQGQLQQECRSDLTPALQHLHQRHPGNRARQPGDVRGRCLHLFQVPQRENDRPTSPDTPRHFAGLFIYSLKKSLLLIMHDYAQSCECLSRR
ncbi:hypothetical protein Trydic_g7532 [Trypoxylus dichotomus]